MRNGRLLVLAALLPALCVNGRAARGAPEEAERLPFGAAFSLYQLPVFTSEVVWPFDIAFEGRRGPKAQEELLEHIERCSSFLVGRGAGRELTGEELDRLGQWIANGGNLVISAHEGRVLFAGGIPRWLGRDSWKTENVSLFPPVKEADTIEEMLEEDLAAAGDALPVDASPMGTLEALDHPLTRGLDARMFADIGKGSIGIRKRELLRAQHVLIGGEGGQALVHQGGHVLVWLRRHGKGNILYLGGELTPLPHRPDPPEQTILYQLPEAAVRLWERIADAFECPRRSDAIRRHLQDSDRDLVTWWRYERERANGGELCRPPVPTTPADIVTNLQFDVGRGERMWRELYVTTARDRRVRVDIGALDGPDGTAIPTGSWEVLVQQTPRRLHPLMRDANPVPGRIKAPYHLVPPAEAPPLDNESIDMAGGHTHTLWLRLLCPEHAAPGTYRGHLRLVSDGDSVHALPVSVTVWPIRVPDPGVLSFEFEHSWESLPGGSFLFADTPGRFDPELLAACMRQVAELGINVGQWSGYFTGGYGAKRVRLRESGAPLDHTVQAARGILRQDPLPALDFSFFDDAYFTPAIAAGLTRFQTNILPGKDHTWTYTQLAYPDAKPMGAEHQRIMAWYYGELVHHLRERGYTDIQCKTMDEWAPEHAAGFVTNAAPLKAAGFRVLTTTASAMWSAESVRTIDPYLDIWQGEMLTEDWRVLLRDRLGVAPGAADTFFAYTASSVPGWVKDSGRLWGWLSAYCRFPALHTHHYFRHYWTDTQPALAGRTGLYNSVAAISHAMGVTRGRYLVSLYDMIERAKSKGIAPDVVREVASAIAGVIGPRDDAILRLEKNPSATAARYGVEGVTKWVPYYTMTADPAEHERAKLELFGLMVRMARLLEGEAPSVRYAHTTLVRDGMLRCRVEAEFPEARSTIMDALAPLLRASKPAPVVRIVCGTRDFAPIQELVADTLQDRVTAHYPAPGRYATFVIDAAPPTIVVVGGDAAGVMQGTELLTRFFVTENMW